MQGSSTIPKVLMDIPQNRIRALTRVISSMSKVNDELFIEPSRGRCIFRVVNSLRTAHLAVVFGAQFFSDYQVEDYADGLSAVETNIRVPCKYLAAAFRNVGAITSVRMSLVRGSDKLVIRTNTIHEGVIKTFEIAFCEEISDKAEPIQMTGCRFRTRPGQLSETLSNFHAKCENIQFAPSEHLLNIKSDDVSQQSFGGTSICLPVSDLLAYEIRPDVVQCGAKVFEQKYCKAFLMLADACNLDACVSFDPSKSPVLLSTEAPDGAFSFAMLISAYEADPQPISATQLSKSSIPDRGSTPRRQPHSSIESGKQAVHTPNRAVSNTSNSVGGQSISNHSAGSGSGSGAGGPLPPTAMSGMTGSQQGSSGRAVLPGAGSINSSMGQLTPQQGSARGVVRPLSDSSSMVQVGGGMQPAPVPAPVLVENQNPNQQLTSGSATSGSTAVLAPATPGVSAAYFQQQATSDQQVIKRMKHEFDSQGASHGSQYQIGYQQQQQVMQQQAREHQQRIQQQQQQQQYRKEQEEAYRKQYDLQHDNWVPEKFTTQVEVSQYVSQGRKAFRVEGDEDVLSESVSPPRAD
eukprot:TRINITY_DN1162_c0_g1_i1.p1 TRINITY_DN1162_c0_g1~~TRINITY_DN1162_c0_g1_i1.p1  ORF type:complete len:577 (+),score=111.96 TRINITY_DN1162_c0_g1_i1:61-1791(+)